MSFPKNHLEVLFIIFFRYKKPFDRSGTFGVLLGAEHPGWTTSNGLEVPWERNTRSEYSLI